MTLIIPMSGLGSRFASAGYTTIKPLIKVDGKTMIEHVLSMYPRENEIMFICNKNHLMSTDLESILKKLEPKSLIIPVEKTEKRGPVVDILKASEVINSNKEALISYCDFFGIWDYKQFEQLKSSLNLDGVIPSYIGFHPHMIGPNLYGHIKHKDRFFLEIKEKQSFTNNKMQEYTAAGIYWFKSGALMKKYFKEAISLDMKTGEEFFCSLPYNLMARDDLKTLVYPMNQFCQWGTPEDLEEYEYWSRYFANKSGNPEMKGLTDIPKSREFNVRPRDTTKENMQKTHDYWEKFFSQVDWHPYNK